MPTRCGAVQVEGFWAKLDRDDRGDVVAWLPVSDHAADVAACTEALLDRTVVRRRLARLGDLNDLSDLQEQRLCFLAALHDLGKFNHGFQNKLYQRPLFPTAGHVREALALLGPLPFVEKQRLLAVLPTEHLLAWGTDPDA